MSGESPAPEGVAPPSGDYDVPRMLDHLGRVSEALRDAGDVHQVLLSSDGVSQTFSVADELYLIEVSLRGALGLPIRPEGRTS